MSQTNAIRLIKRYGNRKLYDTLESRYITLEEIARLVRGGNEVKVIDNENGDDLTTITFAQIILEEEKRRASVLSLGLLRDLIQHGEEALAGLRSRVDRGIEAIGSMGEAAGRRVQEIVGGRDDEASRRRGRRRHRQGLLRRAVDGPATPPGVLAAVDRRAHQVIGRTDHRPPGLPARGATDRAVDQEAGGAPGASPPLGDRASSRGRRGGLSRDYFASE